MRVRRARAAHLHGGGSRDREPATAELGDRRRGGRRADRRSRLPRRGAPRRPAFRPLRGPERRHRGAGSADARGHRRGQRDPRRGAGRRRRVVHRRALLARRRAAAERDRPRACRWPGRPGVRAGARRVADRVRDDGWGGRRVHGRTLPLRRRQRRITAFVGRGRRYDRRHAAVGSRSRARWLQLPDHGPRGGLRAGLSRGLLRHGRWSAPGGPGRGRRGHWRTDRVPGRRHRAGRAGSRGVDRPGREHALCGRRVREPRWCHAPICRSGGRRHG